VLRFDYYGCGDSSGETTDGTLKQWTDDILQAIRESVMETGLREVHLVGSRIGANLALRVAQMSPEVAGVVLWEPVLNGVEYLATLEKAHQNLLHNNAKLDGYNRTQSWFVEMVGYPFTKELYDELAAIDLFASPVSKTPDVLVLANTDKPRLQEYAHELRSQATCVDYISANVSDAIWLKEDRQNKGVVPARAVQVIASWLGRRN
jgi:pimeloyl-ACP methyl ester carboxylesterase